MNKEDKAQIKYLKELITGAEWEIQNWQEEIEELETK